MEGHTDDQGGNSYNLQLSDIPKAVVDYLLEEEGGQGALTWKGYGESKPLSPTRAKRTAR
ncbi:MAG: hypothetical protein IPL64_12030 [Flavobacteriales bacterium]|nr:hypothetical protein [Flavobacteriales bacterium]